MLEIIGSQRFDLGPILWDLPSLSSTLEIRLDCPDDRKFEIVRRASEYFIKNYTVINIDGVGVKFDDGWSIRY